MIDVRKLNLERLNSLTKYPSILTYHALNPAARGVLSLERTADFSGMPVVGREKIDGTNARIVFPGSDTFIIGSREDFLAGRGDLIGNPALSIAKTLIPKAEELVEIVRPLHQGTKTVVFFVEVFGGNVHANSKQYTGSQALSFRGFDVAIIDDTERRMQMSAAEISAWRESGGQHYLCDEALTEIMARAGIPMAPVVFSSEDGRSLPQGHEETLAFLQTYVHGTGCSLDEGAGGKAEGMVVRTPDRKLIAKLRFEDYERTLKRKK